MTEAEKKIADAVKNGQTTIEGGETENPKEEEESGEDAPTEDGGDDGAKDESPENSDKEIDYEAELKKEREARERAERAAAEASFKLRDKKRKGEEDENDKEVEDDKPLTAKDLRGILAQERQATRKELQSEAIRMKAKQLAGPKASQAEIDLIVERHANRTFPEGLSLEDQLEEVYVGIHRKKILGVNNELRRIIRSKDTTEKTTSSTHRESQPGSEPKLAPQDLSALKSAGYKWDGKSRFFIKPLAGGKKTLFYDPKNKKRWVQ